MEQLDPGMAIDEQFARSGCTLPVVEGMDQKLRAYHEAGHAVACVMTGALNIVVEIPADGQKSQPCCGFTAPPEEDSMHAMRRLIAGIMAETHVLGRKAMSRDSGDDRQRFNKELASLSDSAEARSLIARTICIEMASTFQRPDVQDAVRDVAGELLDKLRLHDDDVRRIINEGGLITRLPLHPAV